MIARKRGLWIVVVAPAKWEGKGTAVQFIRSSSFMKLRFGLCAALTSRK